MLGILFSWLSPLRFIGIWIDTIAFSLIDNAYNLIVTFSSGTLLKQEFVENLMDNFYVIIGIFALFRVAILLVNSMINPDKLSEKGNGLSNVLVNFLVMFVLLVMTPVIFKEAIDLQEFIVKGNYVQKLFINADALEDKDPGKAMRSIAIGSLITIDKEALEMYENDKCSKNCEKAIEDYREMEKDGFSFPTISKHIGVSVKNDDGDTVYVYNYMFLVTFAAGCFIAYVLFSFAIDIAVRMVELTVLQILAPLFIATYIDPKSAKSGSFHNWLTTVGKTYASLFIKLAILALMLLLVSIVGNLDHYAENLDLSGFEKLILLIAVLIFAKKAPKWITEMIGIKSEGLGGLGIGKKIKDDMLGGKTAAKAGLIGAGAAVGAAKTAHARHKAIKSNLAKDGERARNKFSEGFKDKYKKGNRKPSDFFGGIKGGLQKSMFSKEAAKRNMDNWAKTRAAGISGIVSGAASGFEAGKASGTLKDLNVKTKENAKTDLNKMAPYYKSIPERLKSGYQDKVEDPITTAAFGSAADRYDAADKANKAKTRKKYFGDKNYSEFGDNLIGGMGDFSKAVTDSKGRVAIDKEDAMAMCYAKAKGVKAEYDGNGNLVIDGGNIQTEYATNAFRNMLTSSGAAHFDEMYNKKQNSVLNEYTSNQESINRVTQNSNNLINDINSALGSINSAAGVRDGIALDPRTGALQITGLDGGAIKIDPENIRDAFREFHVSATDALNRGVISPEEFNRKMTECQTLIDGIEHNNSIFTKIKVKEKEDGVLASLDARQEILLGTVNGIGMVYKKNNEEVSKYEQGASPTNSFLTLGQKSEKLALDADSIGKKVAGVDAKDESDKK